MADDRSEENDTPSPLEIEEAMSGALIPLSIILGEVDVG